MHETRAHAARASVFAPEKLFPFVDAIFAETNQDCVNSAKGVPM
jgi:hypothetical protein